MEVTRRRGRRRKKLLDDLKDRRGYSHLKEEALDRTVWRNRFGRGFGPVVRLLNNNKNYLVPSEVICSEPLQVSCALFRTHMSLSHYYSTLCNTKTLKIYILIRNVKLNRFH